jgi:hypothetical protein
MSVTTLQFRTAQELWQFKRKVEAEDVQINFSTYTIVSRFDKKQIAIAIEEFRAHVKKSPGKRCVGK